LSSLSGRDATTYVVYGLMVGFCASIAVVMLAAPVIVGLLGYFQGMDAALACVLITPWWFRFVIGRLHVFGVMTVISGGRIKPPSAVRVNR